MHEKSGGYVIGPWLSERRPEARTRGPCPSDAPAERTREAAGLGESVGTGPSTGHPAGTTLPGRQSPRKVPGDAVIRSWI